MTVPSAVTTAGKINISLLASTNAQVPAYSGIGGVINVWDVNSSFVQSSGSNVNLLFHFSGNTSAYFGLPMGTGFDLYYNSGAPGAVWTSVAATAINGSGNGVSAASNANLDTYNNNISVSGVQQSGFYALTAPDVTFWNGGTAEWNTASAWDNGLPGSTSAASVVSGYNSSYVDTAVVQSGGTVTVTTVGNSVGTLILGNGNGAGGNVTVSSPYLYNGQPGLDGSELAADRLWRGALHRRRLHRRDLDLHAQFRICHGPGRLPPDSGWRLWRKRRTDH